MKKIKEFKSGMVLKADDLNNIYEHLLQISKKTNIKIRPKPHWVSGSILTAGSLNNFLQDIEHVLNKLGHKEIKWSFGKFKDGTVLKAEYLNEIVGKIQNYI